jgi:hypothetical protein
MNIRILLPSAAILTGLLFLTHNGVEARADIVSAASLTVGVTTVTTTSAVITYSRDKYDYGTRTLCYDPSPLVASHNCVTKTAIGVQGSFTVSGLTAGTIYNFKITAVDTKGGEKPYSTSGILTTLKGATSLINAPKLSQGHVVSGPANFDLNGRSIFEITPHKHMLSRIEK